MHMPLLPHCMQPLPGFARASMLPPCRRPQIHFFILMSRQGKVRLAKWYSTYTQKERARVVKEVTPMVLSRPLKLCNFLDWKNIKLVYKRYASLYFCCGVDAGDNELLTLEIIHHFVEVGFGAVQRLVSGRQAAPSLGVRWRIPAHPGAAQRSLALAHHPGLLPPSCPSPSPCQVLDRYFGNVCELDLIFNFHKAYYILDELLIAGEGMGTNSKAWHVTCSRARQPLKERQLCCHLPAPPAPHACMPCHGQGGPSDCRGH